MIYKTRSAKKVVSSRNEILHMKELSTVHDKRHLMSEEGWENEAERTWRAVIVKAEFLLGSKRRTRNYSDLL